MFVLLFARPPTMTHTGNTFGALYTIHVGPNKTKQHSGVSKREDFGARDRRKGARASMGVGLGGRPKKNARGAFVRVGGQSKQLRTPTRRKQSVLFTIWAVCRHGMAEAP
jgi:hypothetical protein